MTQPTYFIVMIMMISYTFFSPSFVLFAFRRLIRRESKIHAARAPITTLWASIAGNIEFCLQANTCVYIAMLPNGNNNMRLAKRERTTPRVCDAMIHTAWPYAPCSPVHSGTGTRYRYILSLLLLLSCCKPCWMTAGIALI